MNLQVIKELPITVSYGDGLVVAQIRAGNYGYVNSDVTARNFPTKMTGTAQFKALIVAFDDWVESEQALTAFEKASLRPPLALNETLCFGEQHPNEQMEGPIVALGSVWRGPSGGRYVPYLWGDGSERGLRLVWFGLSWRQVFRFLAFRKES